MRRCTPWVLRIALVVFCNHVNAQPQVFERYLGMCDASAAVSLGQGRFVVADDEHNVLRVYERARPNDVARIDITDAIGNRKDNGKATEADLEGAAAIGNRIYWIGSHGRKQKDQARDLYRQRLFATERRPANGAASVLAPTRHYDALLERLITTPALLALKSAEPNKPESENGLSIEGLAATPTGSLLIAFRNPRPQGRALLVELLNPAEVVDSGAAPRFGAPTLIDLGGRGVRSIERVDNRYLIVAGPHGVAADSPLAPKFALFAWSGVAASAPQFVRALDFGTARPEAMYVDADRNELVFLSDDGDEQVVGRDCKDDKTPESSRSFRAIALPKPAA